MIKNIAVAVTGALAAASLASAAIFTVTVSIDGLQEVPPNASPGFGTADVTVDTVTGQVIVNGTFGGLLANAIAAHIHGLADPGVNAGVLIPLVVPNASAGTVTGSGFLSAANMAGLLANKTYINIHSTLFPGGEIRGQIIVPAPAALLAVGAVPFVTRRRRA